MTSNTLVVYYTPTMLAVSSCLSSLSLFFFNWCLWFMLCQAKPNDAWIWNFNPGISGHDCLIQTSRLHEYDCLINSGTTAVAPSWCELTQTGGLNRVAISNVPHTFRGRPRCRSAWTNQIIFFCFSYHRRRLVGRRLKLFHFLQCLSEQRRLLSLSTCAYV